MLHALIKQRQRDIERGKEAAERLARMGHDLRVRDQQREKLLAKMAAKERELGALENKVRAGPGWGRQQAWDVNAKMELHQDLISAESLPESSCVLHAVMALPNSCWHTGACCAGATGAEQAEDGGSQAGQQSWT